MTAPSSPTPQQRVMLLWDFLFKRGPGPEQLAATVSCIWAAERAAWERACEAMDKRVEEYREGLWAESSKESTLRQGARLAIADVLAAIRKLKEQGP